MEFMREAEAGCQTTPNEEEISLGSDAKYALMLGSGGHPELHLSHVLYKDGHVIPGKTQINHNKLDNLCNLLLSTFLLQLREHKRFL